MTTYTWTDNSSGNTLWSDQGNWNDGASGVPDGNDDDVVFDSTWTSNCTADTGYTVGEITLDTGYSGTVTQSAAFVVDSAGAHTGDFTITQGSWDSNGQDFTVDNATSITGTLTCGASACSFGGAVTASYALTVDGTFTGGSGAHTIGSLYNNGGSVTLTSDVTTISSYNTANDVAIRFNGGTFDDGDGTITFTEGTQEQLLYDDSNTARTFYNLIINKAGDDVVKYVNGQGFALTVANDFTITAGEFDTSETVSGTSRDLTVTNLTSVTGTLTCNASTCSFRSGATGAGVYGVLVASGGTFDGGSATITAASINANSIAPTLTMSSGTTTLNGSGSLDLALATSGSTTYAHSNGTVVFTYAGLQTLFENNATPRTMFYNVTVNNAACTLQFSNGKGFALTVANDFTITQGEFDTSETVSGTSRDLTVTNDLDIASGGTLNANASVVTVTGNISNAGTFTPASSSFVMDGTTQTLTGSWTFWSFTKTTALADSLTFENGETYTFGGNVTLTGLIGALLTLESDSPGDSFAFTMSAGAVKTSLTWLNVIDSDASGSDATQKPINPSTSTDGGGNTDWFTSVGRRGHVDLNGTRLTSWTVSLNGQGGD